MPYTGCHIGEESPGLVKKWGSIEVYWKIAFTALTEIKLNHFLMIMSSSFSFNSYYMQHKAQLGPYLHPRAINHDLLQKQCYIFDKSLPTHGECVNFSVRSKDGDFMVTTLFYI